MRPIMVGFASHLKTLCESGALGHKTPKAQQAKLWAKYAAKKKVPQRRAVRDLAMKILEKTVTVFSARCNCASFSQSINPRVEADAAAACKKTCGGTGT